MNRGTLLNGAGERTLRIAAPDEGSWARVELREGCLDRDPVLAVDIAMSAFGVPELTFVQINDPAAPKRTDSNSAPNILRFTPTVR